MSFLVVQSYLVENEHKQPNDWLAFFFSSRQFHNPLLSVRINIFNYFRAFQINHEHDDDEHKIAWSKIK